MRAIQKEVSTIARSVSFTVEPEQQGLRLDASLAQKGCYASRAAATRAIEEGRVFVNGAERAKKYQVQAGDFIVYTEDEDSPHITIQGQEIPLDIRFEDDDLMVISKQADLVCHPSPDHYDGTLVNALIYHCGKDNLCNVQGEDDRLGIVHRLDKDTSGLMLAAKSNTAGSLLMQDIQDRVVDRHYLALVQGIIPLDTGMIDAPIGRSDNNRLRMAVSDAPSARDAVTTFKVLERFEPSRHDEGFTLIDCKLFTGRTHQIRVHMNYIHHACVGDPMYGTGSDKAQLGLERQFLHSYRLAFTHPMTGEDLQFVDGLPRDFQDVLDGLASRSRGITEHGREVYELIGSTIVR